MGLYVVLADVAMEVGLLHLLLPFKLVLVEALGLIDCLNKERDVTPRSADILLYLLPKFQVFEEFVPHRLGLNAKRVVKLVLAHGLSLKMLVKGICFFEYLGKLSAPIYQIGLHYEIFLPVLVIDALLLHGLLPLSCLFGKVT